MSIVDYTGIDKPNNLCNWEFRESQQPLKPMCFLETNWCVPFDILLKAKPMVLMPQCNLSKNPKTPRYLQTSYCQVCSLENVLISD